MLDKTTATPPVQHRRLNARERYQLHHFISDKIVKKDDGFVEYVAGWSDTAVALHLQAKGDPPIPHITTAMVLGVRAQVFGRLRPARSVAPKATAHPLEDRVAELEKRLASLEDALGIRRD